MTTIDRDLFGGAIASKLPEGFVDISEFREVPDNQEVFVENDTDASIIIELFDYETDIPDDKAVRHYFNELAAFNESTHYVVLNDNIIDDQTCAPLIPPDHTREILIGHQSISKYRNRPDSVVDEVYVILVLIRLKSVGTDLLVSLNIPVKHGEAEEAEGSFDSSLFHANMLLGLENCELFEDIYRRYPSVKALKGFVNWLNVRDWSLFINNNE